ncbi:iron complex outermembrane recepter protein [Sphingobacterium nematocida]|uniref:Iron complex outermembrane recepter protein n=1 Tax=Sphingobacterium nematocida TaxID=1513896 RepID=A0A1T5E000_9SPHI|nr:TonB-dependent receptor [Sphingobacterium nematocida]SKB77013.1 iron complex outermembrane recepter protein [Sphingobacterium nematocida]
MKRLFLILPLSCISLAIHAQSGVSDTTSINEVVIAENRLQIPFNKRNRNIQIIQKEDIAKLPVRSINEVLSYIPGVDVRQRGPFGTQADISIDGGSFEQTLILINGVKLSDVQTAHHSMNIPVSLDAIERIEVLKGPAARIYGINALTGAINIITKTSSDTDLSVRVESGSGFASKEEGDGKGIYGGASVQAVANLSKGNTQNLISVGGHKSNGQRYNSRTEDIKAFYQGKYTFDERNSMDVMAGYIHNEFGANGYYAAPGDKESYEIVKTGIVSVGSVHQLHKNFYLKPRLSYRGNKDDYRYFRNDLTKGRSQHESNVYTAELNSTLHTRIGDFGFGLESRYEEIESTNLGDHNRYNHGVYAEYKTEAINKLLLNIGTYLNYNTQYGWQVFPGLDLGYAIDSHWKASLSVGSSQRIPSYTDLYLKQTGNIGNPALKSENAWQYELAMRYEKQNIYVRGGVFYRNIENFIDWIRDNSSDPYQPFNFGTNKTTGVNLSLGQVFTLSGSQRLKYDLSYNYLRPKEMHYAEDVISKYIVESLKHQALLRVLYQVDKLDFTLGGRWIKRELNDPYFITDLRVGYSLSKWNFYAEGNNLLNETYKEVAAVYLPKRWYSVGVRYQWKR